METAKIKIEWKFIDVGISIFFSASLFYSDTWL